MNDQTHEEWRDIPGWVGLYQASNLGQIKSIRFNKERILKACLNTHGYPQVGLSRNGKTKPQRVHRLVWLTFKGEIPDGLELNHIDGVKTNAALSNLEAVTKSQNIRHAVDVLGRKLGRRLTFTPEQIAEARAKLRELELLGLIRYFESRPAPTSDESETQS